MIEASNAIITSNTPLIIIKYTAQKFVPQLAFNVEKYLKYHFVNNNNQKLMCEGIRCEKDQIIALNSISIFIDNLLLNNLITGIFLKFEKQSEHVI